MCFPLIQIRYNALTKNSFVLYVFPKVEEADLFQLQPRYVQREPVGVVHNLLKILREKGSFFTFLVPDYVYANL